MFRLAVLKKLNRFAADLKQIRDGHATTIKKRMKSYLA